MTQNIDVTPGSGEVVAADQITDVDLGTAKAQLVKIADGATGGTTRLHVGANGAEVDVKASVLPTNAAQETGGNLATLASTVSSAKVATKMADGDSVAFGAKADAAVTDATTTNTHMSFLKGAVKILNSAWDSVNNRFNVFIQNTTLAVTQSGNWSTRTQDGGGAAVTSNSTTTSGKVGLDVNVLSVLGTAPTTVGKLDTKVADGDNAVEGITTGTAVTTDANGTIQQYLRGLIVKWIAGLLVFGNKTNNNAAPGATNIGTLGAVANAAQQTWTEGNQVALSTNLNGSVRSVIQDAAGNDRGAKVDATNRLSVSVDNTPIVSQTAATTPVATTLQNAAGTGNPNGSSLSVTGYAVAILNVVSSTPMSGGTTINFEASVDDTTWVAIAGHQIGVSGSLTTTTTADGDFRFSVAGYKSLRARISSWSAGVTTVKGYVSPVSGMGNSISVDAASGLGANIGTTSTSAIVTDTGGTLIGFVRGLNKTLTQTVADLTNGWLNVRRVKKDTFSTSAFTITLASLASSTSGVGRQSTLVTSNTTESALITVKFTVGTTPTANSLIYVYLLRGDGTITDDAAGSSDAGLTVINAPLLGTILCSATTSNVAYYGVFDTKSLGSLGPTFGIAIVNSTGVTANATGGNFAAQYTLIS